MVFFPIHLFSFVPYSLFRINWVFYLFHITALLAYNLVYFNICSGIYNILLQLVTLCLQMVLLPFTYDVRYLKTYNCICPLLSLCYYSLSFYMYICYKPYNKLLLFVESITVMFQFKQIYLGYSWYNKLHICKLHNLMNFNIWKLRKFLFFFFFV